MSSAAAPEALKFANDLAGSFTNLGVTVRCDGRRLDTDAPYSLHYLPWDGAAFGVVAMGAVALQSRQARRQSAIDMEQQLVDQ